MKHLKKIATLKLDKEKCTGCGLCIAVCPHAVFVLVDDKAHIINPDACMECGACSRNCPVSALSVNRSGREMRQGRQEPQNNG